MTFQGQLYHPGQIVPTSGQYGVINPLGRDTGYETQPSRESVFRPLLGLATATD